MCPKHCYAVWPLQLKDNFRICHAGDLIVCVQPLAQLCVIESLSGKVICSLELDESLQCCQRVEVTVGDKGHYFVSSHDSVLMLWSLKESSMENIANLLSHKDIVVCVCYQCMHFLSEILHGKACQHVYQTWLVHESV
jgi:hypothetical protein